MNQNKKKILYSIVRFSPDELKGEIINTGVVFHNIEEKRVKYYLIDDKSPKFINGILGSVVDEIGK